jgi:hypothetical protein
MAGYECFRETYFNTIDETLISTPVYSQFRSFHDWRRLRWHEILQAEIRGSISWLGTSCQHNQHTPSITLTASCVRKNLCTSQQLFYYKFPIVLFRTHLIVLPVRILTHWGIGLFCFNFFASFRLILNVLCADCKMKINMNNYFTFLNKIIDNIQYDACYEIRYTN